MRINIVLLIICLLVVINAVPASAFNYADPGTTIDTLDTGYDMTNLSGATINYIGLNSSGNHVVFTAHGVDANTTRFSTWEITSSGTIIGNIDSATYNKGLYDYAMGLIRVSVNYDWYLYGSVATDDVISLQISDDGGIDLTNSDNYSGSGLVGRSGC